MGMRFFIFFACVACSLLGVNGNVQLSTGEEARKWIESKVEDNSYMIFGKSRCHFTVNAVDLLKSKGVPYDFVALDRHPNGVLIRDQLREITGGYRKVPQVFFKGNFIGGFSDLQPLLKGTIIRRRLSEENRDTAGELIDDFINYEDVVVFGKTHCGFTRRVKTALEQNKIHFLNVDLNRMDKGPAIQDELQRRTGIRTVPQVFVRGKFFGDSEQTRKKISEGLLEFPKQDL